MTPPHIAVVKAEYSPFGGGEIMARDMVTGLLEAGCRVTLVTSRDQPWPLHHDGLRVVEVTPRRGGRVRQVREFDRAATGFLEENRKSFTAILAIDRVSLFTHYHAGGGSHITSLATQARFLSPLRRLSRRLSRFHRLVLRMEREGFLQPDLRRVHCCSTMVARDLEGHYPHLRERLVTIPNSIAWQEMADSFEHREETAAELRRQLSLPDDRRFVLFLGSGFQRKGLDLAISGTDILPDDCDLLVVGKGNQTVYKAMVRRHGLAGRVHFLGPVANGWRLAALCEALVLPARYEPFGLVAAEAQAMGLPVLVSRNTGYADLVKQGKNGIVVSDPDDTVAREQAFSGLAEYLSGKRKFWPAERIRDHVRCLDHKRIMARLLREFLEVSP